MNQRPSVHTNLLDVAEVIAQRSTCSRLHVGAVIAMESRILSTGRNGAPSGADHCFHMDDSPCNDSVHAEVNAIAFAARHGVSISGATMYLTHSPCYGCSGILINSGINAVVYRDNYRLNGGIQRLELCGVNVIQWKDNDYEQ